MVRSLLKESSSGVPYNGLFDDDEDGLLPMEDRKKKKSQMN